MATTNIQGVIETSNGGLHHVEVEPTDAAAASALTIRDLGGVKRTLGEHLNGQTITRIAIQASDGSILTQLYVTQDGRRTRDYYAGERIANSPDVYNIDLTGIGIPVDQKTAIMIVVDE